MATYRLGEVLTGGPFGVTGVFVHDSHAPDAMWVWTARHGVHKTLRLGWRSSTNTPIPDECRGLVALAHWSSLDASPRSALRDALGR